MPDFINIEATNELLLLERYFSSSALTTRYKVRAITESYAHLLRDQIQYNASGAPGPEVGTSDEHYNESWKVSIFPEFDGGTVAVIGTDKPYGRRLEYGFIGYDSLGRFYRQSPRPHVKPAVDKIEPLWAEAIYSSALL